jgi:hypothetical protein
VSAASSASLRPCPAEIRTERLILRRWREDDFVPYAHLSGEFAYPLEAAQAALAEVVACTARQNAPSRRVKENLGTTHDPAEDIPPPAVPLDHPLRMSVLYRLPRHAFPVAA